MDRPVRHPTLSPGAVDLWLARPEAVRDPALLARYDALLSEAERARDRAFTSPAARHEHLVTRALVRTVLARYTGRDARAWRFGAGPHGRPEIDPPCGLRFNVSHARDLVVCAVSRHRVGVDVEPIGRGDAVLGAARAVLSDEELAELRALPLPARRERAVALWTLKEAYAKARGSGLSEELRSVTFSSERGDHVRVAFAPPLRARPGRWGFRLLDLPAHRIALAVPVRRALRLRAIEVVPLVTGSERVLAPAPAWDLLRSGGEVPGSEAAPA